MAMLSVARCGENGENGEKAMQMFVGAPEHSGPDEGDRISVKLLHEMTEPHRRER